MRVQPFKQQKDIDRLKWHLRRRLRDLALFVIGVNCQLPFRELVQLRVKDIENVKSGETFIVNGRSVTMNIEMVRALKKLIRVKRYTSEDFLFQGNVRGKRISYKTGHELVKQWGVWLRLPENYGSSSLRKTFGYQCHRTGQTDLEVLRKLFNQKTRECTMRYLGIAKGIGGDLDLDSEE